MKRRFSSVLSRRLCLVACAVGLAAGPGQAQTLNWGNALLDANFNSAGGAIDATYTFAIGTFSDGFAPTAANTGQWGGEWTALDTTTYNEATGWFTGSYTMQAGDAPLSGRQAYIWVYNNLAGDETSEWVLITDDSGSDGLGDEWLVPAYVDPLGGNPPGSYDWRVSTATTPVWGGLNNVAGAGEQAVVPPSYALQTFSFPAPIPEPSSAVLLALAGALMLRRRR